MAVYTIYPIAVCQGPRDGSHFTYRANFGISGNTACYAWYIKGAKNKIMVDTGATAAMFREKGATETDLISVEWEGQVPYTVRSYLPSLTVAW